MYFLCENSEGLSDWDFGEKLPQANVIIIIIIIIIIIMIIIMIIDIAPFPPIKFKSALKNSIHSQWTDVYSPYSQINSF